MDSIPKTAIDEPAKSLRGMGDKENSAVNTGYKYAKAEASHWKNGEKGRGESPQERK